jgi:lipopolysaccharide transport system ATP-binding protein
LTNYAISVQGLSKQYIIGGREKSYRTFREALLRGLATPFTRLCNLTGHEKDQPRFWALKDVSFDVKPGEIVGVIGRNGAGKTTLLKSLSRITSPTTGRIELKGRVASLLEIGTGFHPELTGRENIYLNGAILGMTKEEIKRKFDAIIAFSAIEKFLDTPVKRFSSGMYVRLAFAVAAHLEPEILVVDEVLAVGDIEFQRKCLGKIGEIAHSGRTVLFVSHNMAAVKSLTGRCIVLDVGEKLFDGATDQAIESYVAPFYKARREHRLVYQGRGAHTVIRQVRLVTENRGDIAQYLTDRPFCLEVELETDGTKGLSLEVMLLDATRTKIALGSIHHFQGQTLPTTPGVYRCVLNFGPMTLASGFYSVDVTTSIVNADWDHYVESAIDFEVPFSNPAGLPWDFSQSYGYGALGISCKNEITFEKLTAAKSN